MVNYGLRLIEKWMVYVIWKFQMCRSSIKNSLRILRKVCIFSLFGSFFNTEKEGQKIKKIDPQLWNYRNFRKFNVQIWNLQESCSIDVRTLPHLWFVNLIICINSATKFLQVFDMVPDFQELINSDATLIVCKTNTMINNFWKFYCCPIKNEWDVTLFLKMSCNSGICLANLIFSKNDCCQHFCCTFFAVYVILIW